VNVASSACPGGDPTCDGSVHASVVVASDGTIDPTANNGAGTSPDTSIITRADLQPTLTVASGNHIAGDSNGFNYTVKVLNAGPSDNHGGHTATVSLPTGISFVSGTGCAAATGGFTCSDTNGLAADSTRTYSNVHVVTDSSLCPGNPNGNPACDGTANATETVASAVTVDPVTNDSSTAGASIITQADLEATGMSSTASSLFANTAAANATTFTYTFQNNGLSDARHVVVTLPDHPLASAAPTFWKLDNLCRMTGAGTCSSSGDFQTSGDIGTVAAGAAVTVVIHAHANDRLGHNSPDAIATGRFTVKNSATVNSNTSDPGPKANTKPNSMSVIIDTVASPPRNAFAIPGTSNVILTWETPSGNGGQPISQYVISVTPPAGKPAVGPFTVLASAPHTSFCGNIQAQDCYQLPISGLVNDQGAYQFNVVAVNPVGNSDPGTTSATPSVNAKNASIPTNTATTLTTCTTATPTNPVCVQYAIPSGAGGVFGAQGNFTGLTPTLCGGLPCFGQGSQALASLQGYNDRTHPLSITITYDSSQIPSQYKSAPICPNNSTSKTCYPNNVKFYAEASFALALSPDPGGTLITDHFCGASIANGGAGNVKYARPNPHTGPAAWLGYTDTAGSLCLVKTNVLGSKPDSAANGDVQLQELLTSDSDTMGSKR